MPKVGFKTLTISESMYDFWNEFYNKRKFNLSAMGINSLSALVTAILSNVKIQDGVFLTKIVETKEDVPYGR